MAYSNWGAFVYRNGERQTDKEDVPPYGDADVESAPSGARIWINLLKQRQDGAERSAHSRCHHAVLGSDRFRVCGYKSYPVLFIADASDGSVRELAIATFRLNKEVPEKDWSWHDSDGIEGKVEGFRFRASPMDEPEGVLLELDEPDGTKWTGKAGYCMGAGWDDVD